MMIVTSYDDDNYDGNIDSDNNVQSQTIMVILIVMSSVIDNNGNDHSYRV